MPLNPEAENTFTPSPQQSGSSTPKVYEPYLILRNVIVCEAAPFHGNFVQMMFDKNDKCPYCQKSISEHRSL